MATRIHCMVFIAVVFAGLDVHQARSSDLDADGLPGVRALDSDSRISAGDLQPGTMLIDRSHGGDIDLWGITTLLEEFYGWGVGQLVTGPITSEILKEYDVLVIPVRTPPPPGNPNYGIAPFSSEEVAAIVSFVGNGGGLWAFHDYNADPAGINSLSNAFGVSFYNDMIQDPDAETPFWPLISNLIPHSITNGVGSYTYFAGCCLSASPPATILATADDNAFSTNCPSGSFPPVLAVVENDAGGCAIFHGDITPLTGIYTGLPEGVLVLNMVSCLAGPLVPEVCPVPAGKPIDFGPEFSGHPGWIILTDQLDECGVVFSTEDPEGVYWWGEGGESSFPYCIAAGYLQYIGGPPAMVDPIRIDFATPASVVSIRGYDGGEVQTMILEAYGAGDVLIDTEEITADFAYPGHVATVTGDIQYVRVRVEGTEVGLFFDDLEWDGIVSVKPTSWGSIKALYR